MGAALYLMERGFYVELHGIHSWDSGMLLQVLTSPEREDGAGEDTE